MPSAQVTLLQGQISMLIGPNLPHHVIYHTKPNLEALAHVTLIFEPHLDVDVDTAQWMDVQGSYTLASL